MSFVFLFPAEDSLLFPLNWSKCATYNWDKSKGKGNDAGMRKIILVLLGALGGGGMLLALVFNCAACRAAVQIQIEEPKELYFPFVIPGTSLVAENLVRYDGIFLEDDSGKEVADAAALMLRNTGKTGIQYATVEVFQGSGKLEFEVTYIPPEASVLVLEKSGQCFEGKQLTGCSGWALESQSGWDTERYIRTEAVGMGSVDVTNITDSALKNIYIYYKTEYAEGSFYLGGVTYSVVIEYLSPGRTIRISPAHYASGSSSILRIEFEENREEGS